MEKTRKRISEAFSSYRNFRTSTAAKPVKLKDVLDLAKGILVLLTAFLLLVFLVVITVGWEDTVEIVALVACEGPDAPNKLVCQIDEQRKAYKFVSPDLELKTMHRYNAPYEWVNDHCHVLNLGTDKDWATYPDVEYYGSYRYPKNYYTMDCD